MMKHTKQLFGIGILILALSAVGCSHTMNNDMAQMQDQLKQKDMELQALKSTNSEQQQQIAYYRSQLDDKSRMAVQAQMRADQLENSRGETELLPPGANPGQCFARVFVPPTYRTYSESVLKHEASSRVEVIPAKYEWVKERVLVKEASERLELIPAKYKWVEEKVMVKSASSRMEEVPARYEWTEERILVKPAHTTWKKGRGLIEKVDNTTGEIMCLVEVPAEYKTVRKRVLRESAKTREVEIPASFKTVKKRVMVEPPTQRKVQIPAEYRTIKVRKMVTPPQEKRIEIPAKYQSISRSEQVTEGRMEWHQVLCETNVTPNVIADIQSALHGAGHDPGPIDGIYGPRTRSAVKTYQKEKGLPSGGLTFDTIKSLGISI